MDGHLGTIYRLHRIEQKFKLRSVAEHVGVPASKLSDFENERIKIPEELLGNLYSVIGLDAIFPDDARELTEETVLKLYRDIAFVRGCESNTYRELDKLKDYVMYTDAYITWLLGCFLYNVYHYDANFKYQTCIECLIKNEEILSLGMRQILYDTIGVYLKNQNQTSKAMEMLKKGEALSTSDTSIGMILYHETMILRNMGCLSESLHKIKKAKKLFDKELNQRREIMAGVMLGNVCSLLGKYEEAERIYLQCLEAVKINPVGSIMVHYNNLAWNCIVSDQYEKALYYTKEATQISNEFAGSINFYKSYAYYKLGRLKEAKKYIDLSLSYCREEDDCMKSLIKGFSSFLHPRTSCKTKEKRLLEAYYEAVKENDLQLQIFILMIIINLDFPEEEIQKEIEYRDIIISLLQKRR